MVIDSVQNISFVNKPVNSSLKPSAIVFIILCPLSIMSLLFGFPFIVFSFDDYWSVPLCINSLI